jgi:hypothetical protein
MKDISDNISIINNKNNFFKNFSYVGKSIKINFVFWISTVICLIIITQFTDDKSYCNTIITFILALLLGWYIHYLSHAYDLILIYQNSNNFITNFIKKNKKLDKIFKNIIYYSTDFHDKIHHNTSINKQKFNLFWEFFQNFLMEGGLLILLAYYYNIKLKIGNFTFKFNKAVLLLWGLLYASVHNINYIILGCTQHVNHHINPKTNYGIDILDILFDTKYDMQNIEDINHASLNLILITLAIIYFKIFID